MESGLDMSEAAKQEGSQEVRTTSGLDKWLSSLPGLDEREAGEFDDLADPYGPMLTDEENNRFRDLSKRVENQQLKSDLPGLVEEMLESSHYQIPALLNCEWIETEDGGGYMNTTLVSGQNARKEYYPRFEEEIKAGNMLAVAAALRGRESQLRVVMESRKREDELAEKQVLRTKPLENEEDRRVRRDEDMQRRTTKKVYENLSVVNGILGKRLDLDQRWVPDWKQILKVEDNLL